MNMKETLIKILLAAMIAVVPGTEIVKADSSNDSPVKLKSLVEPDSVLLNQVVIVGNDTLPLIIPQRNLGRYDRGLYNYLFVPRGGWAFGLTASYGEFNAEDVQLLSMLKDLNFKGKIYSVNPSVSYFFASNQSIGLKFNYRRGELDLSGLSVDFDDDLNFSLRDVSYNYRSSGASIFYRNYVGLSSMKRFAIFNEIDLAIGSGTSRFRRYYNDELRDTKTTITSAGINFSPGVTMFIMDNVNFNISFGVFGVQLKNEKQRTNGVNEGSRFSSGANFKFNLFNINFGIGVHI